MRKSRDIEGQAAKWLIRLDLEDSAELRAEFQRWITSEPRNRAAFLRLEKSWRRADALKNVRPLDGEVSENVLDTFPGALPADERKLRLSKMQARARGFAVAASVLAVGVVCVLWFVLHHADERVYTTDLGGFQRITLQDGSIALLNTNSELRVRLTKGRRQIDLARGEALFEVKHDPDRPFDVKAGDAVVRAVGTAFSVRVIGQQQVDVLVTEGRVAIDPPSDASNKRLPQSVLLAGVSTVAAGETARIGFDNVQVQKIDEQEVIRRLAWTKGRLSFNRLTLAEAVSEFNRYNRRQLLITDPEIARLRIVGVFDTTDLDSFLSALAALGIQAIPSENKTDSDAPAITLEKERTSR